MTDKKVLQCKNSPITYTLLTKQVKHINMRIQPSGEIVVSANPFVPQKKIDEFVNQKISWILKHQKELMERRAVLTYTKEYFVLFGRTLKVKLIMGKYSHVHYGNDILYVHLKEEASFESVMERFMRKLCMDVFTDIAGLIQKRLQDYSLPTPVLKIRKMKSRWGSCIPAKQQITLNQNLIHYPIEFAEYVILHELVHFIQPNHSKAFYQIIEYYMPDYKERIKLAG